ncbi:penicillin-binding transpeptidase domain-containing protein, partial [Gordonia sp. IITR100]|uniref:penicillin-binding transpeptidase domain-containing protein n=1 Tax=Gordonia sp. IITR100 TaxID=1314686 RepID=UPI0026DC7858
SSGYGEKSMAQYVKDGNFGSFTLGPTPVSGLELANVAATLASGGTWCPPNPIKAISRIKRDGYGNPVVDPDNQPVLTSVPFTPPTCEQVVDEGLAHTLANAMSKDDQGSGTSAAAAGSTGWNLPASGKTGTTESYRSSAFLGFTNQIAGAAYVYNDGPTPSGVCTSPLRRCAEGNVYGGMEPARTWFQALRPVATKFGPVRLPPLDARFTSTPRR